MPSDFGDESGEKLVDWMMRVGEDMGAEAMQASAEKLAQAFRNAREGIGGDAVAAGAEGSVEQGREWARLNMQEFEELPEYESIRQIIDESLDKEAVEHSFATVEGRDYLVFKVADAPAVAGCFERLEGQTQIAAQKAAEARAQQRGREQDQSKGKGEERPEGREAIDAEPLESKAKAAKEASRHAEAAKSKARDITRAEMRAK